MTRIIDEDGERWVEVPRRKERRRPRALKFAEIKVGDQLMRRWAGFGGPGFNATVVWYYEVTDLWFDPVAGQEDETAGRMVALMMIYPRHRSKRAHTVRGLASNGYDYADVDIYALLDAREAAQQSGAVVGIGQGHVIRRRPKVPGHSL
jgi:hypothetical protein